MTAPEPRPRWGPGKVVSAGQDVASRRERRVRDMRDASKGAFGTLNDLNAPFRACSHVPNAPFRASRAREPGTPREPGTGPEDRGDEAGREARHQGSPCHPVNLATPDHTVPRGPNNAKHTMHKAWPPWHGVIARREVDGMAGRPEPKPQPNSPLPTPEACPSGEDKPQ